MAWEQHYLEREAWRQQVGENSARLAFAWGTGESAGAGGKAFDKVIDFGLAFAEKPMFSYGFEVLNMKDFDADSDEADDPLIPVSTGFVFDWLTDGRGFYRGAQVGVMVYGETTVEIEHHFGFTGLAIKDLGSGAKLGG